MDELKWGRPNGRVWLSLSREADITFSMNPSLFRRCQCSGQRAKNVWLKAATPLPSLLTTISCLRPHFQPCHGFHWGTWGWSCPSPMDLRSAEQVPIRVGVPSVVIKNKRPRVNKENSMTRQKKRANITIWKVSNSTLYPISFWVLNQICYEFMV